MSSRPAPKRRAEKPAPRQPETAGTGPQTRSQPGRGPAASQPATGQRRSATTSRRRRRVPWLPSPALLGATALVVAGAGAVIASSSAAAPHPTSPYATLAADVDSSDTVTYQRGPNAVSVSRDIDRGTLERQAELQAEQRATALAELARKSQQHADELRLDQWVLPVAGYRLSAGFGDSSYLWDSGHSGLDFAAPSGTPIVSIAHGTVTAAGYSGNCGYMTMVRLDDGTDLMYCHQSSYVVDVGDEVNPGELIGYVGSTGHATGPHLHLEVRPGGGASVDPYAALVAHGVRP